MIELSESDVRRWTDEVFFDRGQHYYRNGYILNPRRQGGLLTARCQGSRPQPYHVEITLGERGIVRGSCSCPVGVGGRCKHAVALLLTWIRRPESFTEVEEMDATLEEHSKAELIIIIHRMLDRYPELEELLELPILTAGKEVPPVDEALIRRQAHSAFHGDHDHWDTYVVAQRLLELVEIGDRYAERERWRDASTVYRTVMQVTLKSYHHVDDERGYLHTVVNGCVEGLGRSLGELEDATARSALLESLFDVYHWDIEFGGVDMGYDSGRIILEMTTPQERERVAGWIREAIPTGDGWSDRYRRQSYGAFLLALQRGELDDAAYLRLCRETERWHDLVERLLKLERTDEAFNVARERDDYDLLKLADLFVSYGHASSIEVLMSERALTSTDRRLTEWLKERACTRGDEEEALELSEQLFWQRPDVAGYQELKSLARSLGRWTELRATILSELAGERRRLGLLIDIYLEEQLVADALAALAKARTTDEWVSPAYSVKVAEAAEEAHPQEAISLYVRVAESLIARRGRSNYQQAVVYLTRVRDLTYRLGAEESWEAFITELRERNSRLRALKDELNRAGL
ncbi:MAG: SWIM zinc finger domain-containing protein [Anaerolineales bacterium]